MTKQLIKKIQSRIIFFEVKTKEQKCLHLVTIATDFFEKKKPLLFKLSSKQGLDYLDRLLWAYPKNSFLPHSIQENPCEELIVLTTSDENLNRAHAIFNLSLNPISDFSYRQIYEFEDMTSSEKHAISQKRYQTYKTAGCFIVSL